MTMNIKEKQVSSWKDTLSYEAKHLLPTVLLGGVLSNLFGSTECSHFYGSLMGLTVQRVVSKLAHDSVESIPDRILSEDTRASINTVTGLGAFWVGREVARVYDIPTTLSTMLAASLIYNTVHLGFMLHNHFSKIAAIQNELNIQKGVIIELNDQNFEAEVLNYPGPVFIDAYCIPCAPCEVMKPVFYQLSAEYGRQVKFATLNVGEAQEVAQQLEIYGVPRFFMFLDGKMVHRVGGLHHKEALEQMMLEHSKIH